MAKRITRNRIISILLSMVMVVSLLTTAPMTAFAQTTTHNYNGLKVDYSIMNSWADNQNVQVTLTNTGTEPIRNWALQYDPHGTIMGVWDGQLYGENIVRSAMHNSDIAVGGSVTFGYTLTNVTGTPDSFALCNYRVEKESGYTVTLTTMPDWGSGFTGMINIANTTNAPIMAWELSFDTNFAITSAGDFVIMENAGNSYKITGFNHNGNIPANSSVTLNFNATSAPNAALSNISMTEVVILATPPTDSACEDCEEMGSKSCICAYLVPCDVCQGEYCVCDTDGDGLPDIYELFLGTDPLNPDTDGDGLPDGYEVFVLGTNPLLYSTSGSGKSDGEYDFDGDGLSNYEEYILDTDPWNPDTDGDGLTDWEEVFVYFTDPLNPDTDDDGVWDGDEIKLGLDPNNPQTFGYPDIEYTVFQVISSENEILAAINEGNEYFQLSIEIEASGWVESNLVATESGYS